MSNTNRDDRYGMLRCLLAAGHVVTGTLWAALVPLTALQSSSSWVPPQSGWLYVVSQRESTRDSDVLVVNPRERKIIETVPGGGYQAVFAADHAGRRVYILSGAVGAGVLNVVDTRTGRVIKSVPVPDRIVVTLLPEVMTMAVAHDDKWVFVQSMRTIQPGEDYYSIMVLRAEDSLDVTDTIPIPGCGVAHLVSTAGAEGWDLMVRCSFNNSVKMLALSSDGTVIRQQNVSLPTRNMKDRDGNPLPNQLRRAAVAVDGSQRGMTVVMSDGLPYAGHSEVLRLDANGSPDTPRFIPFQEGIARGTKLVYVGSADADKVDQYQGRLDRIHVFDRSSGRQVSEIQMPVPFHRFVLSEDGLKIYTVCPLSHSVTIVAINEGNPQGIDFGNDAIPVAVFVVP